MEEVLENSSYYEVTCSETDYSETTSRVSSTNTDISDDGYNKVDAREEHFNEVTEQINKIGVEIDECMRSFSQTENEIKEAEFKLEELELRRQYKELMLNYNSRSFGILTKRQNQLLASSEELISRFQVVGQAVEDDADTDILKQLEDLEEKRGKVAVKIERVIQELNEDAESLGHIAKKTEEVKLRIKELFLHQCYTMETMELNRAMMDVLSKSVEHLSITADHLRSDK